MKNNFNFCTLCVPIVNCFLRSRYLLPRSLSHFRRDLGKRLTINRWDICDVTSCYGSKGKQLPIGTQCVLVARGHNSSQQSIVPFRLLTYKVSTVEPLQAITSESSQIFLLYHSGALSCDEVCFLILCKPLQCCE